jgi:hypothetical protein
VTDVAFFRLKQNTFLEKSRMFLLMVMHKHIIIVHQVPF